jgi:DNA-binding XRE family transcriptional regulator
MSNERTNMNGAKLEQELRKLHSQLSHLNEIEDIRPERKGWEALYQHIGLEIRSRRLRLGLKQTKAAELMKIGRTSLNNIEAGRSRFPIDKLYFISALLGCTVHDLLPRDFPDPF